MRPTTSSETRSWWSRAAAIAAEGQEPSPLGVGLARACGRTCTAFTRPIATPFVGRDGELDQPPPRLRLDGAKSRRCSLADGGRAARDRQVPSRARALTSLAAEARIVVGRCAAYGEGTTYLSARRDRAGGSPEPSPTGARRAAGGRRARPGGHPADPGCDRRGRHAGSPEETAWAFRRFFETLAAPRPLVVVIDDIHWAEPTLLDLLEYVARVLREAPRSCFSASRGRMSSRRARPGRRPGPAPASFPSRR